MDKFIEKHLLEDNATGKEQLNYVLQLTEEEKAVARTKFTNSSIKISVLNEEEKERKDDFKNKMKPLTEENTRIMSELRSGVREFNEEVFLLADQEEGMMGYYTQTGVLVQQRPLLQEERQLRISRNTAIGE